MSSKLQLDFRIPELPALLSALRLARQRACAYGSPKGHLCDCKFGGTEPAAGSGRNAAIVTEEQCGCPELYVAIWVLESMREAEYKRLLRRATRAAKKGEKDSGPWSKKGKP